MGIIKKMKLFFMSKTAIKKLLAQKDRHIDSIGKRRDLNSYIKNYTKKIFLLSEDTRDVECAFYLKSVKQPDTRQLGLIPMLLYTVKISCCTKLKIIIVFDNPKYIKFKLFNKDKSEKNAEMKDIDTCFTVMKILLEKNKCTDGK